MSSTVESNVSVLINNKCSVLRHTKKPNNSLMEETGVIMILLWEGSELPWVAMTRGWPRLRGLFGILWEPYQEPFSPSPDVICLHPGTPLTLQPGWRGFSDRWNAGWGRGSLSSALKGHLCTHLPPGSTRRWVCQALRCFPLVEITPAFHILHIWTFGLGIFSYISHSFAPCGEKTLIFQVAITNLRV